MHLSAHLPRVRYFAADGAASSEAPARLAATSAATAAALAPLGGGSGGVLGFGNTGLGGGGGGPGGGDRRWSSLSPGNASGRGLRRELWDETDGPVDGGGATF